MYADDILALCSSETQLKQCILVIEEWCKRNGMQLNKLKSGIIPFANRNSLKIPFLKLKRTEEEKV